MSAQLSMASLVAAGLIDGNCLDPVAPRRQPRRPRRGLFRRQDRRS